MHKFPPLNKLLPFLLIGSMLVSLYPSMAVKADAPTAYTFSTIASTGAIVSNGGTSFSQALDVSGVPANDYMFYTVSADYSTADDAWSSYMKLKFSNGATTTYLQNISASQGGENSSDSTTLYWSGVFERKYTGGGNLTIHFTDPDTSGTYTSYLTNVVLTLYPASTTSTTFPSFNTGTITSAGSGSGTPYNKSLDVSHVPDCDYLFFTVVADWTVGTSSSAWSSQMKMGVNDGSSAIYFIPRSSQQGGSDSSASTTLYWAGLLHREYTGDAATGTRPLYISFSDPDTRGSYTSSLQNVTVSIYPSPTVPKVFTTFETGVMIGGGTFTKSLDVTGLAADDYLFYTVSADFTALSGDPWSSEIMIKFSNGSDTIYKTYIGASQGADSTTESTTLYWSGLLNRKYTG